MWKYRELVYFLAWRDITVRYKQTAIGILWALLRPGLTMAVFVAFRHIAGIGESSGAPESVVVYAAVLPWQLFSSGLTEAAGSLIGNANLITKVYFPRILIPIASIATCIADFVVTLGILALLMAYYKVEPTTALFALPLMTCWTCGIALGLGLLFAALNVKYRDFRYVVPFIVQFGMFVSPVAISSASISPQWRPVYSLNPLVGIIEGMRWSILGGELALSMSAMLISLGVTLICLFLGVWYFRRTERTLADVI